MLGVKRRAQHRRVAGTLSQSATHPFFALVVECRCGFVQKKNWRVVQDGAGDGNTLDTHQITQQRGEKSSMQSLHGGAP